MEHLEKLAKDGSLPNVTNNYWVVTTLAKAGLPEEIIREVVNGPIANTPVGPGPAPGAPAAN